VVVCPGTVAGVDCAVAGSAAASAPPAMATDKNLKYMVNPPLYRSAINPIP
jgi:hypothetical protein